jgi:hypothetical protein
VAQEGEHDLWRSAGSFADKVNSDGPCCILLSNNQPSFHSFPIERQGTPAYSIGSGFAPLVSNAGRNGAE